MPSKKPSPKARALLWLVAGLVVTVAIAAAIYAVR